MNKVKITVAQEKAFNIYKNAGFVKSSFVDLDLFVNKKDTFIDREVYKPLKSISNDDFAKMLCGWYEVEQPFKVGDWFFFFELDQYAKIETIKGNMVIFNDGDNASLISLSDKEHCQKVTEPYKIMLLNLGREKLEFKMGDICATKRGQTYRMSEEFHVKRFRELFENDEVEIFHPIERGVEVSENV